MQIQLRNVLPNRTKEESAIKKLYSSIEFNF